MNAEQLKKINKIPFNWITKCETCGARDFKISNLTILPLGQFIATCRCNNCGKSTKRELFGSGLEEKIKEAMKIDEKGEYYGEVINQKLISEEIEEQGDHCDFECTHYYSNYETRYDDNGCPYDEDISRCRLGRSEFYDRKICKCYEERI